jgi:hypothetical protein
MLLLHPAQGLLLKSLFFSYQLVVELKLLITKHEVREDSFNFTVPAKKLAYIPYL